MSGLGQEQACYAIGWDVGGWNCDKNTSSRDAIAILDGEGQLIGQPWRGNLRESINAAMTTDEWLNALFQLCHADAPLPRGSCFMAIDIPLGFSNAFRRLVIDWEGVSSIGDSASNPYLYRETERHLLAKGWRPMSPLKDMIGSQATKGIHVLAKFAPLIERCGFWTDGAGFFAFESYPTVCREAPLIREQRKAIGPIDNADKEDAIVCALVARLMATAPEALDPPGPHVPVKEGWIWVPHVA